jgi:chromosome segregation ATPase
VNTPDTIAALIAAVDEKLSNIAEKRAPLEEGMKRARQAIKDAEAKLAAANAESLADLEAERARTSRAWLMHKGSEETLRAIEQELQAAQQAVEQRKAAATSSLASARAGLAELETEAAPLGTAATHLHTERVRLSRAWLRARAEEIAAAEYNMAAQQLAEARAKLHAIAETLEAVEFTHDHHSPRTVQQQQQFGTHGFAHPRSFEQPLTLPLWPGLNVHKAAVNATATWHTVDPVRTPRADPRHHTADKLLDINEYRRALAAEMAGAGVQPR